MIIYNEIITQFLSLQSSLFLVEGGYCYRQTQYSLSIQIFLRYKTLHKIKKNKEIISPAK